MNANGSNSQLLNACDPGCAGPVWSADGGQVVYTVIDGTTAHVRSCVMQQPTTFCNRQTGIDLTSSLTLDLSPDGSQIAYLSSVSGTDRIGTANLNGSEQTFVTPDLKSVFDLAWGR
jgi:Tol biopolymer transport system component